MAKKEYINITKEGLNLLTVLTYHSLAEMSGFYEKEVFLTDGFEGEVLFLFQALGNLGATARNRDLDSDIDIVIVGNHIMSEGDNEWYRDFEERFEKLLNQNNSPYRRTRFISENHLVWYMENRAKSIDDKVLDKLLVSYKKSRKKGKQQQLF